MTTEEYVRLARQYAGMRVPWMAQTLNSLRTVMTPDVPTAACSNTGVVYWNPDFVDAIVHQAGSEGKAIRVLAGLWYHEASHFLRNHGIRKGNRNHDRWNIACDCEINDHIPNGLLLPEEPLKGCYPSDFNLPDGELAEWYYDHLPNDLPQLPQWGGSASDGIPRPWETEGGLTEAESDILREQTARAIEEHRKQGSVPRGWERWAKAELTKRIDWRKALRRYVGTKIGDAQNRRSDYTFRRRSRRSIGTPFYLPSLQQTTMPRTGIVVDTSGSVTNDELSFVLGEVVNVVQTFQTDVTVIPCDAKAYNPQKVRTRRDVQQLHLPGGGGTNMIAGIQAAQEHGFDVIVVMTDGYTEYPTHAIKNVIWVIYHKHGYEPPLPPSPPWRSDKIIIVPL